MFVIRRLSWPPSTNESRWVYVMEVHATDFGYTWTCFKDSTKYNSVQDANQSIRELMIDHAYGSGALNVIPVTCERCGGLVDHPVDDWDHLMNHCEQCKLMMLKGTAFEIGDTVKWSEHAYRVLNPHCRARGIIRAILPDGLYKVEWSHPADDRWDKRFRIGLAHDDYITGAN